MIRHLRGTWPLWIALALLAAALALLADRSLHATEGQLTYAIDDPYIHLAVARNLVQHGTWGVSAHEFSSPSSSPLWTLLVAGLFAIAGPHTGIPFALGACFAAWVLVAAHAGLRRRGVPNVLLLPSLVALVAFTPLPTLVFVGLEHPAHLALTLLFMFALADVLDDTDRRRPIAPLLLLAAALGGIRYEALFTIAAGALLLALAGRARAALALFGVSGIVPLAFGLFSVAHGSGLLPNSILLKGNAPSLATAGSILSALGGGAVRRLRDAPHLAALLLVLAAGTMAAWAGRSRRLDGTVGMPLLIIVAGLAHVQFAQVGWFFRYEAYLVGAAIVALSGLLPALDALPGAAPGSRGRFLRRSLVALALLLALPSLGRRAASAFHQTPQATRNIHEQQVQMGRFARQACAGEAVALDDIGAVSYLADIRCVDLIGLANSEALRATRSGRYDSADVKRIVARGGARTAIVYDAWFAHFVRGGVPAGWTRAGVWSIRDRVSVYSDSVSFYAIQPADAPRLIDQLRAFAPRLPAGVRQSGAYRLGGS